MSTKQNAAASAALAALGVGRSEQSKRMAPELPAKITPKRIQISLQFTEEGLLLLQKAQAKLLERGVRRASMKGAALEVVLTEWLSA